MAGCAGTRSATVGSPAVVSAAIGAPVFNGAIIVSGPGQKAAASRTASSGRSASACAAARSDTCTISGLNEGRPLAA